jgi:phosphoribosylamine--glycine ligase
MITGDGPKVLEFNVRFGDPETQAVLPLILDDLGEIFSSAAAGGALPEHLTVEEGFCSCVVMASGGYPGTYGKGFPITGLDKIEDAIVFQAGTAVENGKLVTGGGRVLSVASIGDSMEDSLNRTYRELEKIDFKGKYYRKDIGRTSLMLVGILMGSESDKEVMKLTSEILGDLEIPCEVNIMSAHRTPDKVKDYASSASERGLKVLIAGAGLAAHLAGAVAAHTILPVIGVPLAAGPLNGMDSLLSTVQMPKGIPVATVAIGSHGARNAAYLAAQIIALENPEVATRLKELRGW